MRRKGERPVAQQLIRLSAGHPILRSIAEGDHWFYAWVSQCCTPHIRLAKQTGISPGRIRAIDGGDIVSRAEIDALARAWNVSTQELISTLPDPSLVVE